jgi:hypothetical protein
MVEQQEGSKAILSNFISSLTQVVHTAEEQAHKFFKNSQDQGKDPLNSAINTYLQNFANGLQIIYNQLDDDKRYMELVTKCRKVPLNQSHGKEATNEQSSAEDLLEPLKKFQELFDE